MDRAEAKEPLLLRRLLIAILLVSPIVLVLAPSGCSEDCKVQFGGTNDPYLEAQQRCWRIRPDNGQCDDVGHDPICEGMTLSCPTGQVLGKDCPGAPFQRPDAGN